MKIKGITFGGPMVRAIRDGRKDMTRRIVKPQGAHMFPMLNQDKTPREDWFISDPVYERVGRSGYRPPYAPGDILYVREAWRADPASDIYAPSELNPDSTPIWYEANGPASDFWGKLRPAMFMCRWMARTWLRVVSVRAERVQDIGPRDALDEGLQLWEGSGPPDVGYYTSCYGSWGDHDYDAFIENEERLIVDGFRRLWNSIHGPDAWDRNDWVWVIGLEPTEKPEGVDG